MTVLSYFSMFVLFSGGSLLVLGAGLLASSSSL